MGPYLPIGYLPVFQEPDEKGPGDIEHLGRLLRGEFGVEREQGHSMPPRHLLKDLEQ
jgi:hypothetical protein